jgi:peptide/nickel transport system ATP-binding protein
MGLGILFITHDLSTAAACADRVVVMYRGRIVEMGPARSVIAAPRHPYTRDLIAAVPRRSSQSGPPVVAVEDAEEERTEAADMGGCPYAARCRFAEEQCRTWAPELEPSGDDACTSTVACRRAKEISE